MRKTIRLATIYTRVDREESKVTIHKEKETCVKMIKAV
jgi:hypothetical protein